MKLKSQEIYAEDLTIEILAGDLISILKEVKELKERVKELGKV
tara:strand:- start:92 stop:220 length:129 start_codon:yes stop_codon:yes gene_type:complete